MEVTNIIYQCYSNISLKSYIGLTTKTLQHRWKQHLYTAFRTNKDGSWYATTRFYNAVRKYPLDSWILTELYHYKNDGTELPLEEYEKFFITKYNSYYKGYNSTFGGEGTSGKAARVNRVSNRKTKVKGYMLDKRYGTFTVQLSYLGNILYFDSYKQESDAKNRADYLMSLSDEDLVKAHKEYKASRTSRTRGYTFHKANNKFIVKLTINGTKTYFGSYITEQEAINKVAEVRKELGII